MAVLALGSTGCLIVDSSSASSECVEFERIRLIVLFVSARSSVLVNLEDILPRCRTEDCDLVLI
jgi:hypothetical protein